MNPEILALIETAGELTLKIWNAVNDAKAGKLAAADVLAELQRHRQAMADNLAAGRASLDEKFPTG